MTDMTVTRLGFTPVKGMAHGAVPSLRLGVDGPPHDRVFCVVDLAEGAVLRTARDDISMACSAAWAPPVLSVWTPDGEASAVVDLAAVSCAAGLKAQYWDRLVEVVPVDGPWAALLGRHFGRRVELCWVREPGGVVWSGSVSIVTTSSLAELARRVGRPSDDGVRFRPTVVVDSGAAPAFVEDTWAGRLLRLGPAVVTVGGLMPRCAVVDRRPDGRGRDVGALAALAPDRTVDGEIAFGVHADVALPGLVHLGDPVVL